MRLTPKDEDDEIIVSKKGLAELRRQAEQAEERAKEIERLRREIAELRRRLQVHENPNVPPSVRNHSPGYARARPLVPSDKRKKPGSKPGHEGVTRPPLTPDQQVALTADRCRKCRSHRLRLRGTETQQEIEVERKRRVTEYTVSVYECLDCGEEVRATLPDGNSPVGYGPQLQTEIVLGKIEERLPYRKLEERLTREGIPSCPATLQAVVWGASEKLQDEEAAILQRLRAAPWVHADESSYRIDGRKVWIWVFCTEVDLLLVIRPSRGREVVEEVLGKEYTGRIVCDGWKGYWGWVLQRCWAHLLRYAKAGAEVSEEGKELYGALCALHEQLTKNGKKVSRRTLARRLREGERVLRELLDRFGRSEAPGIEKVVTYLRNGMPWWLTFLKHRGMDATNNRGERGLREAIVIRKIIGTLRNWKGAKAFARLLSVLGTWKLRGENPSTKLYAALS
ncbi:transposase IS66 family [mine drainage metagenome]|uniref:Transposase IS66 family n=1 Tax=mine drainage metagenome TaxID=410659 RepID=T1B6F2_9ZZZZ